VVRIELTETARQEIGRLYGPLASAGMQMLRKYTTQELAAVLKYLNEGRELQRAQAVKIRTTRM
jgi:hypothetical protein